MNILLVDNGTRYLPAIQKLLAGHTVQVVSFEEWQGSTSPGVQVVVLSGGSKVSYFDQPEKFAREIAFIQHANIPVIGICLGFELVAGAFGATFKQLRAQEKGLLDIYVLEPDMVFGGKEQFRVYENHRVVVDALPANMHALAKSKDGIEVVKHNQLPIYGFQFHPEMFPDAAYGDEVFLHTLAEATTHVQG
jgi:GMP synthase (glutamine-hydrolysing)